VHRIHLDYTWHGDLDAWRKRLAEIQPGDLCVLNPSNGPTPDDETERRRTRELCHEIQQREASVLGYVHIAQGNRNIRAVLDDMRTWYVQYGVHRIFFDEVPSTWSGTYLHILRAAATAFLGPTDTNDIVAIFNPGAPMPLVTKIPPSTLVVVHEGPYATYPAGRMWGLRAATICYDAPSAEPILGGPAWQAVTMDGMKRDNNPFDEPEKS
jgi:hypothetical protein